MRAAFTRLQRLFVFPGQALPAAEVLPVGVERWWREIPEGRVEAWYMRGAGASEAQPAPAVVFAHGNGELIDHWADILRAYVAMGVSVLLPEYRGFGRSAGTPSQAALVEDTAEFVRRLVERPEVDRTRLTFHGRSLGGGVVCALGLERPPRALVLQSTFTSLRAVMQRHFVPGSLVADPFDNEPFVSAFEGPTLVVHGTRDSLIPFSHAQRLTQLARNGQLLSYPVGHNDCPPRWEPFWWEVRSFLADDGLIE